MDLLTAAARGNIAELAANKQAGSDLSAPSPDMQVTPLTMAAVGGQVEATQWLLDNGADVNGRNGDGGTALTAAAFLGSAGVAKVLIDGGSDTAVRNWEGQSAADLARFDWDATEYILNALVRPAVASMLQLEVDRETIESGRARILAMIEGSSGASTGAGYEELAYAILTDDAAAAKAALAAGADADARDPNTGGTPLIFAALMGRADIAKMLLAAGADINATDSNGTNALTVAELDWQTTQDIAAMFQIPLTNPEAIKKGKAQIAKMLRAKM